MLYLLVILFLIYISCIFLSGYRIFKITDLIKTFETYLQSAEVEYQSNSFPAFQFIKHENYRDAYSNLLLRYPEVFDYCSHYELLDYSMSDSEVYRAADSIYKDLFMSRNFLILNFKKSFNPINSCKLLFSLPGHILKWLGLHPSITFSRFFSLLTWIFLFITQNYSAELKQIIAALLKHLIQA